MGARKVPGAIRHVGTWPPVRLAVSSQYYYTSIAKLQGVNSSFPPSWPLAEAQVSSVVPCCVQVEYTPLSIGTRATLGLPASCAGPLNAISWQCGYALY